ncbi:piggyBac transposable element-derived protein 4-like [Schistocerca serialis cubense]|uniref:piggyBac transposable element-derived protein 4-like n=1 Tax=Schistocerca serialis cubense TaxID=2023355 RepID=UPI00214E38D3|nr:piggyBac transposable element-derived protein 4-like [Schistocerca serialis cubense]
MDVEPQNIRPDNSERRPRQRGSPARYHTGSTEEWADIDCFPSIDIFSGDHGVTNLCGLDADSSVLDFFSYFVDRDLLAHYKEQTNLYARQKLRQLTSGGQLTPACRMFGWTGVTLVEVKKFLAIIFHMSISQKPFIGDHWSQDPCLSCNYCPNLLTRNRFLQIMSNFHLNDNSLEIKRGEPGYDPLHEVHPLVETICLQFQQAYLPDHDIMVDEGMCKYRGRIYFKQYLLQKPSKYGMKLCMLSESNSGYIWNLQIFCGQSNVVVDIVKNLLGTLVGKGHTLFTDRFYTSPIRARELEK